MHICYRMSGSNEKNVVFAYESSVHSINVLLSLNDQRQQDLLCDLTILVEDQRFRAHRSVLAACSEYFLARIVNQSETDPIITLPEQVTVKGFGPLLQFAYTAKLLLNKDNVSEVCKCAEFLGVRNIEASCFQFLKFKFAVNKADQQDVSGKRCCKSLCQKVDQDIPIYDPTSLDIDERVEEFFETEHVEVPCSKLRKFQDHTHSSAVCQESVNQTSFCFDRENVSSLCPKYRKFQQAFKEDRIHSPNYFPIVQGTSVESTQQSESIGNETVHNSQENAKDFPIIPKFEQCLVKMEDDEDCDDPNSESKELDVYPSVGCSVENVDDDSTFSSHSAVEPHGFLSVPFSCNYEPYDGETVRGVQNNMQTPILNESLLTSTGIQHQFIDDNLSSSFSQKSDSCTREESSSLTSGRRNVEIEVAEHLAKGFWCDIYSTETVGRPQLSPATSKEFADQIYQEKKSECPWLGITITDSPERTFTNLSSVNCPFISTLATEGFSNSSDLSGGDYIVDQQEKCQYDCVGEDSETDTEGDSESCSPREQESEVKLPFNARRIISLSRNDFQALLKVHKLTSEQLDFVHDIRRRSKNRIAAQRCRKRKLDCIQNLETEIEKLQDEKDNLLKERDHILSTLGETKNNLTELCQEVCREAALSREQIQILAKYSTSECPLSFLIPEKEQMPLPESVLAMSSCAGFPDSSINAATAVNQPSSHFERKQCDVAHDPLQEARPIYARMPENTGHVEHCVQSGITDFCRQMTDKCTTDEYN